MHTKLLIATLVLGLCVGCYSGGLGKTHCVVCYPERSGEQIATFHETNDTFAIRTLVFREKTLCCGGTLLGAYYIFETKAHDEENWREFMVFRHDNLEPINEDRSNFVRDRVVLVDDRVAFVYIGWMYAVTTDAGRSWNLWNGIEYPFSTGRMGYDSIQGVQLLETGVGTMKVNLIGNNTVQELRTSDSGANWRIPGE